MLVGCLQTSVAVLDLVNGSMDSGFIHVSKQLFEQLGLIISTIVVSLTPLRPSTNKFHQLLIGFVLLPPCLCVNWKQYVYYNLK